ncbi:thioester reductase domain-containing protein [Legionella bononiensis]|uniref:Thioester reductase domain-containing protein n=1 Tax=Legionella bononiensis TaxID=2793102 RepID=A0ABS1WFC7_9GAMM|nr:thioester reductase domain-containing protein [Legionella bononiensis]MBL7479224.1 thioester reductase domain-containing protein [Legionella bononiensis]MBL7528049.1 thioester reductase domain-containing protein [Legionella bononiensis]MBL7563874.1 thioester reductase domain-containing protein [Legionella bononiensis]
METTLSCIELIEQYCINYESKPAFGFRKTELIKFNHRNKIHYLPEFETLNYKQVWQRISSIATGWNHSNFVGPNDFVGICGFGSPEFVLVELSCLYLCAISVPLQTNMREQELTKIVIDTNMRCLVASLKQLHLICNAVTHCPSVKSIIVIDCHLEDEEQSDLLNTMRGMFRHKKINCDLLTLEDLERLGKRHVVLEKILPQKGSDQLVTLVYTSGSTGLPKGAMITEKAWRELWSKPGYYKHDPDTPLITLNFMPLSHMFGRMIVINSFMQGGTTYFALESDLSTIFEDFLLVRPTVLYLVPRISELIYQNFQIAVVNRLQANKNSKRSDIENEIISEMKYRTLGDRLSYAITASAPTSPEVMSFLKRCFNIPVIDVYGSTELGVLLLNNQTSPQNVIDYKLVSIPELNYFTTDKPYPRGELYMKTNRAIIGYYKDPSATADLFDADGYIKTGDIVEEHAPNTLFLIDRVKNVIKLGSGEFVTLLRLEHLFSSGSRLIKQIFLYGSSQRSYLLSVIVPNISLINEKLAEQGLPTDPIHVKQLLLQEIHSIAKSEQLRSYEIPLDIIIEMEPFSQENQLVTESNKLARNNLKKKYEQSLEKLYEQIEQKQLGDLANLGHTDPSTEHIIRAILGVPNVEFGNSSFVDLGGDSLDAVRLTNMIQSIYSISIPVSLILNPTYSIRNLIKDVNNKRHGKTERIRAHAISFTDVHPYKANTPEEIKLFASDLKLSTFFSTHEIEHAKTLAQVKKGEKSSKILLTGANGYLGRFLALALLERLSINHGTLVCFVRAQNNSQARNRMLNCFQHSESALKDRFIQLAQKHLVVYAADLTSPNFGLNDEIYNLLATEVDMILHNGALVNHVFSYEQLFETNVMGTVEVIRFAFKNKLKPISFISTVAVSRGLQHRSIVLETEDIREQWPIRYNGKGYAEGYATSKWAGEVLLKNFSEEFNLPVHIFRCGMILAHSNYSGEINTEDFFTRLIAGIIQTRIAPKSFYRVDNETSFKPSFDGLPVDFIADTIADDALIAATGHATYVVTNPTGNSTVNFDVIINWIEQLGYKLDKIEHYEEWYHEFTKRLKRLTKIQKKYSPLHIIYKWEKPGEIEQEIKLDNSQFYNLVKLHSGSDLPVINKAFINKCLMDMYTLKIIGLPKKGR